MAFLMGRQYELFILSATGNTGELCAEHISTHLPTDLRWAVAGRSGVNSEALVLRKYGAPSSSLQSVLEELYMLLSDDPKTCPVS